MSNDYFDSYSALPRNQLARAEAVNAIVDAVIVGFDTLPDIAPLKQDRLTYADDTGTVNVYAVSIDASVVALTAGLRVTMKVGNTNTAASTLNVNSIGAVAIRRFDGSDVVAGDMQGVVIMVYDGTYFILVSQNASQAAAAAASASGAASSASNAATSAGAAATSASAASSSASAAASSATAASSSASAASTSASTASTQASAASTSASASATSAASAAGIISNAQWAAAGGTADAITATFPTTVVSLTNGLILGFRALLANATTTPTFKADGTTAHTITRDGGGALVAGDIKGALAEYLVRYNLANTRWELLNPATHSIASGVSGLGSGVATLLGGTASGTGGPAGTASPAFTGIATFNNASNTGMLTAGAAIYCGGSVAATIIGAAGGTTDGLGVETNEIFPLHDNHSSLGDASLRWTTVYATTGTINTSDRELKTAIRTFSDAEISAAKEIVKLPQVYKWKDSVVTKGDAARWHFGFIAQDVFAVFTKYGLQPFDYGCCCADKLYTREDETLEDGTIVPNNKRVPSGETRYGVRDNELHAFCMAALWSLL